MLLEPVPGRECGACNVCCKLPTIVEPGLKKPPGVLCQHWAGGCTIYETRPGPCRGHFCAWRRIEQFDDSWRPDRCHVYAEVKTEPNERYRHVLPEASFALKFTVFDNLDEKQMEALMATVEQLVASDVPVVLAVAAPARHMGGYRLVNAELKEVANAPEFAPRFVAIFQALMATPPLLVPLG